MKSNAVLLGIVFTALIVPAEIEQQRPKGIRDRGYSVMGGAACCFCLSHLVPDR